MLTDVVAPEILAVYSIPEIHIGLLTNIRINVLNSTVNCGYQSCKTQVPGGVVLFQVNNLKSFHLMVY